MIIRKAVLADIPAMHDLVKELAIYEKEPEAVTATLADYKKDFTEGVFSGSVAEVNGVVVGTMIYYLTYSTWKGRMLYLEDFVIRESHRREGIGQLLFDAFLAEAKRQGVKMVKWQVLDWNEPAIKFYEKNQATIERYWWNVKIIF